MMIFSELEYRLAGWLCIHELDCVNQSTSPHKAKSTVFLSSSPQTFPFHICKGFAHFFFSYSMLSKSPKTCAKPRLYLHGYDSAIILSEL